PLEGGVAEDVFGEEAGDLVAVAAFGPLGAVEGEPGSAGHEAVQGAMVAGVVGDERGAGRSLAHHDAHAVGEEEEDQVVAEPTRVPGVSQLEEVDPGHGAATLALGRQPHDPEGNEPGIGAVTHRSGEPRVGAASAAYPGRLDVEDF